jgi:uncharacterized damage-inducible protein DinB
MFFMSSHSRAQREHQTHHRGQLTTLLSQLGEDYGVTDLMWLPGLVSQRADVSPGT